MEEQRRPGVIPAVFSKLLFSGSIRPAHGFNRACLLGFNRRCVRESVSVQLIEWTPLLQTT